MGVCSLLPSSEVGMLIMNVCVRGSLTRTRLGVKVVHNSLDLVFFTVRVTLDSLHDTD